MKILLACSAGMSTSLLEKSINEYMKENKIKGSAVAYDSGTAKRIIDDYDIVLLGPQVRFMEEEFKKIAGSKPVAVIPPADYAMAKAENVMKFAKEILKK